MIYFSSARIETGLKAAEILVSPWKSSLQRDIKENILLSKELCALSFETTSIESADLMT